MVHYISCSAEWKYPVSFCQMQTSKLQDIITFINTYTYMGEDFLFFSSSYFYSCVFVKTIFFLFYAKVFYVWLKVSWWKVLVLWKFCQGHGSLIITFKFVWQPNSIDYIYLTNQPSFHLYLTDFTIFTLFCILMNRTQWLSLIDQIFLSPVACRSLRNP